MYAAIIPGIGGRRCRCRSVVSRPLLKWSLLEIAELQSKQNCNKTPVELDMCVCDLMVLPVGRGGYPNKYYAFSPPNI